MKNLPTFILCLSLGICLCLIGLVPPIVYAANSVGSMIGDITGFVTDENGNQVPPQAAVHANVDISVDEATGSIVANVIGSAACTGGLGVYVEFQASYDVATGALTGTYTDNTDSAPRPIAFEHTGGANWRAHIEGTSPSKTGPRPYSIYVDLNLPATALYGGNSFPPGTHFTGPLNSTFDLTVPLYFPQFGINQTAQITLQIEGGWEASVVPLLDGSATLTGVVSGTFRSAEPLSITVTTQAGSMPLSIPIQGQFGGTLTGNDVQSGSVEFAGNWTQSGGGYSFGGDMVFSIPIKADGSMPSININFAGAESIDVMGISVAVPFQIKGTIPFVINQ